MFYHIFQYFLEYFLIGPLDWFVRKGKGKNGVATRILQSSEPSAGSNAKETKWESYFLNISFKKVKMNEDTLRHMKIVVLCEFDCLIFVACVVRAVIRNTTHYKLYCASCIAWVYCVIVLRFVWFLLRNLGCVSCVVSWVRRRKIIRYISYVNFITFCLKFCILFLYRFYRKKAWEFALRLVGHQIHQHQGQ